MFSLAISFFCGKNRLATNSALLFVYKPNPNPNSGKFHTQKNPQKNIHTSKFSHTVYVTKKQGCRKEEKTCLKTNLHLSTKRQQQQSETSRTSSGCTGRQGHCRRSALLSHPGLMPREKDSERCLCSDKEKKNMCKKMRNLDKLRLMPVEDLVPLLVHKTGSGFYCSPSGKEYPTYKDAADDCVCWLNADVCMIRWAYVHLHALCALVTKSNALSYHQAHKGWQTTTKSECRTWTGFLTLHTRMVISEPTDNRRLTEVSRPSMIWRA